MKKILFVIGSLREESFNKKLAKEVEKLLEGKALVSYLDYSKLPYMNQDLESPVSNEVSLVRDKVNEADLLWIFSPVYNASIPGVVKNLLDWLSRGVLVNKIETAVIREKKVTVSSMGYSNQDKLFEMYNNLLTFIGAEVVGEFSDLKIKGNEELELSEDDLDKINKQINSII